MHARVLALVLLVASLALVAAAPPASAGCVGATETAAGHTVTVRAPAPTKPDYVCVLYVAVDGQVLLP
jgi:hypothetical protein